MISPYTDTLWMISSGSPTHLAALRSTDRILDAVSAYTDYASLGWWSPYRLRMLYGNLVYRPIFRMISVCRPYIFGCSHACAVLLGHLPVDICVYRTSG
ncbi:hypothetical protein AVEN_216056-1 [Araneus ventricosus]|uniref:Uncharacterized protein n=1 Tax=Araneus ventricosus TaxID=182803 RepID=A0A4Y2VWM2_ARAVE|nr:hypothetical protein AVEN_216056-1 [Araneus ventricosus]